LAFIPTTKYNVKLLEEQNSALIIYSSNTRFFTGESSHSTNNLCTKQHF
jgi:hypothetical protein